MKHRGLLYMAAAVILVAVNPNPSTIYVVVHMAVFIVGALVTYRSYGRPNQ